ncbi:hypothetical protein ACFL51_00035 [Myxococcota bacterium]
MMGLTPKTGQREPAPVLVVIIMIACPGRVVRPLDTLALAPGQSGWSVREENRAWADDSF